MILFAQTKQKQQKFWTFYIEMKYLMCPTAASVHSVIHKSLYLSMDDISKTTVTPVLPLLPPHLEWMC